MLSARWLPLTLFSLCVVASACDKSDDAKKEDKADAEATADAEAKPAPADPAAAPAGAPAAAPARCACGCTRSCTGRAPAAAVASALTLTFRPGANGAIDFSATPPQQAKLMGGMGGGANGWDCANTSSAPPPCGWASKCADLGERWANQLGSSDAADTLSIIDEYQEDCGDDGSLPYQSESGDFVAHGGVMRHQADVMAEDGVRELLVQERSGWRMVARLSEVAVEGMSVQNRHVPRASWEIELDAHPGKELVTLISGTETGGDSTRGFARLLICHVSPKAECRRIELSNAKQVDLRTDGTVSVDGGPAQAFTSLPAAESVLMSSSVTASASAAVPAVAPVAPVAPAAPKAAHRCKLSTGSSVSYDGDCIFRPDGSNGSFSISPARGGVRRRGGRDRERGRAWRRRSSWPDQERQQLALGRGHPLDHAARVLGRRRLPDLRLGPLSRARIAKRRTSMLVRRFRFESRPALPVLLRRPKVELEGPRRARLASQEVGGLGDVVGVEGLGHRGVLGRLHPTVENQQRDVDTAGPEVPRHRLGQATLGGLGGRERSGERLAAAARRSPRRTRSCPRPWPSYRGRPAWRPRRRPAS